jgi:subtilase family serine protease
MNHLLRSVALLGTLEFAVAGCGGSHVSSPAVGVVPGGPALSTGTAGSSFIYDRSALRQAVLTGPASFSGIGFDVVLKMRDTAGLSAYAASVSTPGSGAYRQFLTPAQIADRFGASAQDQAAARTYLERFGLSVTTWPQRMLVHVAGTQSQLEAAFNTRFGTYKLGTDTIIAPMTPPSVPAPSALTGSPNIVMWAGRIRRPFVRSDASTGALAVGYSPQQVAAAFDYSGAYAAGYTGKGINIAIIGTGPVAVTGKNNITLGDMEATRALFGVGGSSTITLPFVGNTAGQKAGSASGFATPLPVTASSQSCDPSSDNPSSGYPWPASPISSCNPEDTEAQLDTEQAGLLARDSTIEFYLAYNPNDFCPNVVAGSPCPTSGANKGFPAQGILETDAEIQQAIADNTADVVSMSFGESELDAQGSSQVLTSSEIAALVAEGIAVFVSSGDSGAQSCQATGPSGSANTLCANFPATDPNAVAVGGVTAALDGAGQPAGPLTAWGVQTGGGLGGSGGGLSTIFLTPPSFQSGLTYPSGGSTAALTVRGIPDVSLLGDPATGVAVITDADSRLGGYAKSPGFPVGGTSVAAPQMAAMWALVLQACSTSSKCAVAAGAHPYRLGNPNPLFYALYGKGAGANYHGVFTDILYGTNAQQCVGTTCPQPLDTGYTAGTGFDLVTGLGVPSARNLIKQIAGV